MVEALVILTLILLGAAIGYLFGGIVEAFEYANRGRRNQHARSGARVHHRRSA